MAFIHDTADQAISCPHPGEPPPRRAAHQTESDPRVDILKFEAWWRAGWMESGEMEWEEGGGEKRGREKGGRVMITQKLHPPTPESLTPGIIRRVC